MRVLGEDDSPLGVSRAASIRSDALGTLEFKPKARIIRTIGDQLISGPEAAIIELVKNAYDADASEVRVKFVPAAGAHLSRLIVSDNGHGMQLRDIQEKWMEPATSNKKTVKISPGGRAFLGSKGIGRFAAAKLGRVMALNSSTIVNGKQEEIIIPELDWSIFSEDVYLSDISIDYLLQQTNNKTGTEIEISQLLHEWNEEQIQALHIELRKLISPLKIQRNTDQFKIYLDLSELSTENVGFDGKELFARTDSSNALNPTTDTELTFEVTALPLLTTCDYEVEGAFDKNGLFSGKMTIHRGGLAPENIKLEVPLQENEASCAEVGVKLYVIDREAVAIKNTMKRAGMGEITAAKARQIADEMCGVSIYKNGFRIRPYGEENNDWLTLDTRRVQNPTTCIGHNQVAGYVTVQDEDVSGLFEKSSREGFEENLQFRRLRALILTLFKEQVEPRRYKFRKNADIGRSKGSGFKELHSLAQLTRVKEYLVDLPPEKRRKAEEFVEQEAEKLEGKISAIEERQAALEAKSSMGLIVGEIMHEGGPATQYVYNAAVSLNQLHSNPNPTSRILVAFKEQLPKKLRLLLEQAEVLKELFAALKPLAGGKRGKPTLFNPVNVALDAKGLFESSDVEIKVIPDAKVDDILGFKQDLATALVNLISNSIYWLRHHKIKNPKIDVEIRQEDGKLRVFVTDNGRGVPEEFSDSIFDISFSLKEDGTGLGLNIAQEAVARSGGVLKYHQAYSDGARFELQFNH